jgi:nucleoside-diphosphate-sugar epimerase
LQGYVSAKTLCEKELISYNNGDCNSQGRAAFEVVTLLCGLVAGDTLLPSLQDSLQAVVSPLTGAEAALNGLKFMQALHGAVPLVHVDDVCEAHVFCMDRPSINGRFLCAAAWLNMRDIVDHYARKHRLNPAVVKV